MELYLIDSETNFFYIFNKLVNPLDLKFLEL